MNWDAVRAGFLDEMEKIAAISMKGLSTETIMGAEDPPPMETVGFQKARDILSRAQMFKTAASKQVQRALPTQPGLNKMVHQGDDSTAERTKSVAGYGLAGVGTGTAAHRLYSSRADVHAGMRNPARSAGKRFMAEAANNRLGHRLMVGGGLAGLGYGAYRQYKKSKESSVASPGLQLKAAKQVGATAGRALGKGPSLRSQSIGTIGQTGRTL